MQNTNDHRPLHPPAHTSVPMVTGSTDVYLIVGDPVQQVRAPETFNLIFASLGIDAILVPVHIAPAHLSAFVKTVLLAPNIKGLWVAIPHKAPIVELLDSCCALGAVAGAVNGVRRNLDGSLQGGLFDGEGFVAALGYFNMPFADQRVLIIGAGGGAAAIGASLALARPQASGLRAAKEVAFFDPVPGKANAVATRIAAATGAKVVAVSNSDPSGYDLVVNASPLGLNASDPLPCDVSRLEPHAAFMDIVMKNQPTPVVRAARARGLNAQPGFEMMIQQAHLYLDFFGFSEAAQKIRTDATALRAQIYPAALQAEIKQPFQPAPPRPAAAPAPLSVHPS